MDHDDFKFEPVRGLPEELPPDEYILWQGSPSPRALAREALNLNWVLGYFALVAIWRAGVSSTQVPLTEAMGHSVPILVAGMLCAGLILGIAWVQAKATVYTLTNKRVALRIGAALTMTLNLPYVCIGSASLDLKRRGTGTLAFELMGDTRLSFLMTWPHVRPWHFAKTQPALRCIPNAQAVAELFQEAAEARVSVPRVEQRAPTPVAAE